MSIVSVMMTGSFFTDTFLELRVEDKCEKIKRQESRRLHLKAIDFRRVHLMDATDCCQSP